MSIEIMKDAYGMLYTLEASLRAVIQQRMIYVYGPLWQKKAPWEEKRLPMRRPFDSLYIHELENFFSYTAFRNLRRHKTVYKKFINSLHLIYPLRNKIAHCRSLSQEELQSLQQNFDIIIFTIEMINLQSSFPIEINTKVQSDFIPFV